MAVYIELMPIERRTVNRGGERSRRAGVANVRRPFRGIEIKEPTHAYFRVVRSDGTPLDMVDSSSKTGRSTSYANFLLQSIQEQRVERQQILETFGAPYVFFFGESPRFLDIIAVVIDTHDFNWHAEWWENYEKYLRGTRLAERGSTALLHFDDTIIEGYPVQCSAARDANTQNTVQIQLRMFVTNYLNVSNIGDINFPIHENAVFPEAPPKDESTFSVVGEDDPHRVALLAYLQRTAIQNIQMQILRARSIERARELQRQYALEQLGVETKGADLLSIGQSILQGAVSVIKGDNESGKEAEARLREEMAAALSLAKNGRDKEAKELLSKGKIGAALSAILASPRPSSISLQDALRSMLLYSAPSPAADLAGFLQRLQSLQTPNGRPLVTEMLAAKSLVPVRSKIWDNYDEYTQRGEGEEAANYFAARTGIDPTLSNQENTPNLARAVTNAIQGSGGSPTPRALHGLGLMPPAPKGYGITLGYNDLAKGFNKLTSTLGIPGVKLPLGDPNHHTFHKQWGSTPDVGGSYGGMLGGAPGAGIAGQGVQSSDFFSFGSGLPQGTPWGGHGQAPFAFTDGHGPTGDPLYEKKYTYGSKPKGSYLGGGVQLWDAKNKSDGSQGKGYFSLVKVEGSLL